jgi:hypothetical protein
MVKAARDRTGRYGELIVASAALCAFASAPLPAASLRSLAVAGRWRNRERREQTVWPRKTCEQRWAVWNSTRLNDFKFRLDDIVIST